MKKDNYSIEEVKNVLADYLFLTDYGWDTKKKVNFDESRERLTSQSSLESINRACWWLNRRNKTKRFNKFQSSYGLKHIAEEIVGYTTNGQFIIALILSGFEVRFHLNHPNVDVKIQKCTLSFSKYGIGYGLGKNKRFSNDSIRETLN